MDLPDPLQRLDLAPFSAADLPGTGGRLGGDPEDFQVTEIPAYAPEGAGGHCFVRIRKRGITTPEAAGRLARALGRRPGDVGWAGLKDRHALTEQWISLPEVTPDQARGATVEGVEVLEAAAHPQKLRTGHLRGNRFRLRLVDVGPDARARARAVLAHLAERGLYHWFGPQRFGRGGDNLRQGHALLAGGRRPRGRRQLRLLVSAVQSALFNDYLLRRLADGPLDRVLPGEICQTVPRGGVFRCDDVNEVGTRLAAGEVRLTGPLHGPKMRPAAEGRPAALEDEGLAAHGLTRDAFRPLKKVAPGGRRPLTVRPEDPGVTPAEPQGLWVSFTLPAGAYATVVVREITRTAFADLRG